MANSVTTKLHLFALPCHSSFHKITFQYKYLSSFLKLVNVEQLQFRSFKTTTQNFQIKEVKNKIQASLVQQWNNFYSQYEEFVGVADVQEAQNKVKEAEKKFLVAHAEERAAMRKLSSVRDELKHLQERLSHVNYSNPLYLQLANKQHELVTNEEKMQTELDVVEEKERDSFWELSGAMRDSYEKERARVERTKNWSLIGTVVGAIAGMFGSIYINRVRTHDLKQMILNQANNEDIKESIDKVNSSSQLQYEDIKDEIRQLQVALINKLLAPPAEKKGEDDNSSDAVNFKFGNSSDETLQSVVKALQSLDTQLRYLSDKSTNDHTDKLLKAITDLKADLSRYSDAERLDVINVKLDELKSILLNNYQSSNDKLSTTANHADEVESNSSVYIQQFVWISLILGTVYYIITV